MTRRCFFDPDGRAETDAEAEEEEDDDDEEEDADEDDGCLCKAFSTNSDSLYGSANFLTCLASRCFGFFCAAANCASASSFSRINCT